MTRTWKTLLSLGMALVSISPAAAETLEQVLKAPQRQRVYDYAGVLTPDDRARLRSRIAEMERQRVAQGAVVVVKRVEGLTPQQFAHQMINRWGIGERKKNNGFVLLVALQQRKWRLGTGKGLRKRIPDDLASRLMQRTLVPAFREERYAEGLNAALIAIHRAAAGQKQLPVASETPPSSGTSSHYVPSTSSDPVGPVLAVLLLFGAAIGFGVLFGAANGSGWHGYGRRRWGGSHHHHHHHWTSGSSDTTSSWSGSSSDTSSGSSGSGGGDFGGGSSDGGGASGSW